MIFETLHDSSERGELMLVDGGMCHWHLRRDGQLTIREIISTRRGAGSQMLNRLCWIPGATSLYAKCPSNLDANEWYSRRGFVLESIEITKTGRRLQCWRLPLFDRWKPNTQHRELIFVADGNMRFADLALDSGWLYGARLPATVYRRPYMVDQDWRDPDRNSYMAALKEYRPWMATVLDWEHDEQLPEVLEWANEAAQYVQVVIIIPKVHGGIAKLPRSVHGKPVRLGYSVPTSLAGTYVPIVEFQGWPVHLLGGSPSEAMRLARLMNVRSMDTNYHHKLAMTGNYFFPAGAQGAKNRTWPTLGEVGGWDIDVPYEAFRRSCLAIKRAWDNFDTPKHKPKLQMALPFVAR